MADHQVIVVTGSSRGVGRGIVQLLAEQELQRPLIIYATSRTGLDSGINITPPNQVIYRTLDIVDRASIQSFFTAALEEHGAIDVLINNAAVSHDHQETPELAAETLRTNYGGSRDMCEAFLAQPSIRPGARIVNVTSGYNRLQTYGTELQKGFRDANDIEAINKLATAYLDSVRHGQDAQEHAGWGTGARSYKVSKALINTMTIVLGRIYPGVLVNCCCPGWCDTAMGNTARGNPPKTPEEGARVPTRLAIGDLGPNGDVDGGLRTASERITGHFYENANIMVPGWGTAKLWLDS